MFLFSQERKYSADVAKIYSIHITNVVGGVASQCRRCALSSSKADSACVPCPLGHYMVNGTRECERCPPNTFIKAQHPVGKAACIQCGPNTNRNKVRRTKSCLVKNRLNLSINPRLCRTERSWPQCCEQNLRVLTTGEEVLSTKRNKLYTVEFLKISVFR